VLQIVSDRKTLAHPSRQDAIWRAAIAASRGQPKPLPVVDYARSRVIGWVKGVSPQECPFDPGRVYWRPESRRMLPFTSYDDLITEITNGKKYQTTWSKTHTTAPVANNWQDLWPVGGAPVSGTYPGAARVARQLDDTTVGAQYFLGNKSPDTSHLILLQQKASATSASTLILYDRVLTYEACTISNANQVMTNGVAAQRYIAAGQPGLDIMITVQSVLGATASAFTQLRYTDQDGNTLQVMPVAFGVNVIVSAATPTATLGARIVSPSVAAATIPTANRMPLLAGDTGVRLINDYTLSANNTGTIAFVLMQPLAVVPFAGTAGLPTLVEQVMQTAGLERVYDGACLAFLVFFNAATAATVDGSWAIAWG
jgi:hypothetical protein